MSLSLGEVLLLAVGLSMDAFAVSVTGGATCVRPVLGLAVRMAAAFGLFQAVMPVVGWGLGIQVLDWIRGADHWVACGLLSVIGGKMVVESFRRGAEECRFDPGSLRTLLLLAVATSIDALAVGVTLSVTGTPIGWSAGIIGTVTFVICAAGVFLGRRFGSMLGPRAELLGGLVLVGMGWKIVWEHLGM